MVVGTAAPTIPFATLALAPIAVGFQPMLRPELMVLGITLFPLSFCYAVMRHQFMGIRRLVHRSAAYLLLSFAILILYTVVISAITAIGGTTLGSNVVLQLVLLVLLFAGVPFISGSRRLAFAAVDRLLYKEHMDYGEVVRRVSLQAASTHKLEQLQDTVLKTIAQDFRLSFAAFVEVDQGQGFLRASIGTIPEPVATELTTEIGKTAQTSSPIYEVFLPSLSAKVACARLQNRATNPWVVCFGPRTTEEPLQRDDLEAIQIIIGHLSTIVEKLQLLEELQKKSQELREMNRRLLDAQEEERFRISAYLHDEPLQKLNYIIWACRASGASDEVENQLRELADELRNFTVLLRPAVLDDLGLVRALEWLVAETSSKSEAVVRFSFNGISRDDDLEKEIELALYRVAQEALTNCLKHAQASLIQVSLDRTGNTIRLRVIDNGVGIKFTNNTGDVKRLGVASMRERVEQFGGVFSIRPRRPSGTIVEASIPLRQETPSSNLNRVSGAVND